MIRTLAAVLFMLLATPSFACIWLEASDPAQGEEVHIDNNRVELEFIEAVEPSAVLATVHDEQGRQVSTGEIIRGDNDKTVYVILKPQSARTGYAHGDYVVRWRVPSAHESSGEFTFRVHKHGG